MLRRALSELWNTRLISVWLLVMRRSRVVVRMPTTAIMVSTMSSTSAMISAMPAWPSMVFDSVLLMAAHALVWLRIWTTKSNFERRKCCASLGAVQSGP